jgi:hypothetical protein
MSFTEREHPISHDQPVARAIRPTGLLALQRELARARGRRRLDVLIGVVAALIAILIAPGLAIAALIAVIVLVVCAVSLLVGRGLRRHARAGRAGRTRRRRGRSRR